MSGRSGAVKNLLHYLLPFYTVGFYSAINRMADQMSDFVRDGLRQKVFWLLQIKVGVKTQAPLA
ncbi:hypothetical protein OAG1_34470 [Agarivorans sp. OAG1]|nr:hypothetical protein OAG1_34470 [Agarivorans sp. OAG1]